MPEHPNAKRVRDAVEAWNSGNMEPFADLVDNDIVWHEIGGRTLKGKAAVEDSMSGAAEVSLSMNLHDVVANDDHAVALVEVEVKSGDEEFRYRTAELYHMSDGKITERWAMAEDTQAISEFFSRLG